MKKKILFLLTFLTITGLAKASDSLDLEVVWQKEVFPREIMDAKFSADGQWIYATVANPPELIKYSAMTGDSVSAFDWDTVPKSGLYDMDLSVLGNLIVTFDGDNTATLWDTHLEKAIKNISYNKSVIGVAISPDEKTLIVMLGNLETKVYNIPTGKETRNLTFGSYYGDPKIKFSHNGQYFFTGTVLITTDSYGVKTKYDQIIRWNAQTLTPIDTIESLLGDGYGYDQLKFSKNEEYLLIVRKDWYGRIYSLSKKQNLFNSIDNCVSIELLPDNQHFLVGYQKFSTGNHVELHNFQTKINDYILFGGIIDNYNLFDNWKIFCTSPGAPITFLNNKPVNVKEENFNNPNINISQLNGNIFIETQNIIDNNIFVDVIDLQGKSVYQQTILNTLPNNKIPLNIDVISGIYIVNVKAGNKDYSQKIEIVR